MSDLELDLDVVRETRALHPERIAEVAARRVRRPLLRDNGRLMLVAADHPARGALGVRGVATAMEDRIELLTRLVRAIRRPGVDGVLGTPDILEDLLLLGALDDKVVIGSMNRGGLQGATFELDDRFTAYDVPTLLRLGLDGGKMLTRIDLSDPGTARTLEHCGAAVSELAAAGLLAMVEPFMSAAKAIGSSTTSPRPASSSRSGSRARWGPRGLHLAEGAGRRRHGARHGGHDAADPAARWRSSTSPDEIYASWAEALALPGVRGLVVGRALLYPPDDDVAAAVDSAVALVGGTDDQLLLHGEHAAVRATGGGRRVRAVRRGDHAGHAGWEFSSLRVLTSSRRAAVDRDRRPGDDRAAAVGWAVVGRRTALELAGRSSVFAGPTDVAYLPVTRRRGDGAARRRFAVAAARATPAAAVPAPSGAAVPVELRGAGSCSRQVNNFGYARVLDADRIIACEVITPAATGPPTRRTSTTRWRTRVRAGGDLLLRGRRAAQTGSRRLPTGLRHAGAPDRGAGRGRATATWC